MNRISTQNYDVNDVNKDTIPPLIIEKTTANSDCEDIIRNKLEF